MWTGVDLDVRFDCGFYDCEVVVDSRPILRGGLIFGRLRVLVGMVEI